MGKKTGNDFYWIKWVMWSDCEAPYTLSVFVYISFIPKIFYINLIKKVTKIYNWVKNKIYEKR